MRKQRRVRWWFIATLVAVAFLAAALLVSTPPLGKFHVPGLTGGKCCWQFHDGHFVEWIYPDGGEGSVTNVRRRDLATYRKERGEWIIVGERGPEMRVRATLLSLRLSKMDESWSAEYRRCW